LQFGPDSWDRVVCVMTTGQAWQFRPYKWSEPKTLFHHGMLPRCTLAPHNLTRFTLFAVKGFYMSWTNDPPNAKIKDWNVTELKVHFQLLPQQRTVADRASCID